MKILTLTIPLFFFLFSANGKSMDFNSPDFNECNEKCHKSLNICTVYDNKSPGLGMSVGICKPLFQRCLDTCDGTVSGYSVWDIVNPAYNQRQQSISNDFKDSSEDIENRAIEVARQTKEEENNKIV